MFKKAIEFLNNLEKNDKERIWNKLHRCKIDPFHFLEHLEDINGYKLRVGDYRLIIDVDKKNRVLYILKVGNRKKVYD